MKLGVFDSGIGGKALAASLEVAFPEADIYVVGDHENVPYGSKTPEQIIALTDAAIQPLLKKRCDAIIIACNSATMAAIETLRSTYPQQAFIGLEPMVKPAAKQSRTGVIGVCATPVTLASKRYKWLVDTYAPTTKIIQPDCSNWARMIESGTIDKQQIERPVRECLAAGADVIVLGCTHYHWIKGMVEEIVGEKAIVLEPSEAIARRVKAVVTHGEPAPVATATTTVLPASGTAKL